MPTSFQFSLCLGASVLLGLVGCSDDSVGGSTSDSSQTETSAATDTDTDTDSDSASSETGDSMAGDGDGDGDTGDGDGDPAGDGDGDSGDGDGDGDGDSGDGDGDSGDGDGDSGDGDGDVNPVCGDGMVSGDEVCDDGVNDGAYGGCAQDCLALGPFCGDAELNGPETCDDGDNAEIDDGCLPGCLAPASCLEILAFDAMAPDGSYAIQPEGLDAPVMAACDMASGGWTLAMRFAPAGSELHFYASHWSEVSLLNEGELDPEAPADGKFHAFDFVLGAEIRGCLQNPDDQSYGCKAYDLPMNMTLLDLFTSIPVGSDVEMEGLFFGEDQDSKLEWLSIQGRNLNEATVNPQYIETGINIDDDQSCYDAKVRFGLVLNNEANISTLNDTAGFGAQSYFSVGCDLEGEDSGWKTGAGFAAGPNIYETAGHIWIR